MTPNSPRSVMDGPFDYDYYVREIDCAWRGFYGPQHEIEDVVRGLEAELASDNNIHQSASFTMWMFGVGMISLPLVPAIAVPAAGLGAMGLNSLAAASLRSPLRERHLFTFRLSQYPAGAPRELLKTALEARVAQLAQQCLRAPNLQQRRSDFEAGLRRIIPGIPDCDLDGYCRFYGVMAPTTATYCTTAWGPNGTQYDRPVTVEIPYPKR